MERLSKQNRKKRGLRKQTYIWYQLSILEPYLPSSITLLLLKLKWVHFINEKTKIVFQNTEISKNCHFQFVHACPRVPCSSVSRFAVVPVNKQSWVCYSSSSYPQTNQNIPGTSGINKIMILVLSKDLTGIHRRKTGNLSREWPYQLSKGKGIRSLA